MNDKQASQVVKNIFNQVFNKEIKYTLEQIREKFAFDVKLPQKVTDSLTKKTTWAISINPNKFISQASMEKYEKIKGWMQPKQNISTLNC